MSEQKSAERPIRGIDHTPLDKIKLEGGVYHGMDES